MCEPKRSVLPGVLAVAVAAVAAPAVAAVAAVAGGVLVALSVAEAAAAVLLGAVVYVRVRSPRAAVVARSPARPALARGPLALENKTITVTPDMFVAGAAFNKAPATREQLN